MIRRVGQSRVGQSRGGRVLVGLALTAGLVAGCGSSGGGSASGSAAGGSTTGSSTSAAATAIPTSAADCPTTSTTSLAKTKFALHAGLAFGGFHRYIWKPYQAGTFASGAHGRTLALVKAAATAALDVHEIKLAAQDVRADPALCRAIAAPLARVTAAFSTISSRIRRGDTSSIASANSLVGSVSDLSRANGHPITEQST